MGPGQTCARLRLLAGPEARTNPESWSYAQSRLSQKPGAAETQPGLLQGTGTEAEQESQLASLSTHLVLSPAGMQSGEQYFACLGGPRGSWREHHTRARWVQAEPRAHLTRRQAAARRRANGRVFTSAENKFCC